MLCRHCGQPIEASPDHGGFPIHTDTQVMRCELYAEWPTEPTA
jgi:hypothetical protein